MKKITRRRAITSGLVGGAAAFGSFNASGKSKPTPSEVEGPFYPITPQKDKDFDLTVIEGHEEKATGEVVTILGKVFDLDGKPIEDASVELWQANAVGRYAHPRDRGSKAKLDPDFQGWAVVPSGEDGGFKFVTIVPGSYPAAINWDRPPHIHFKITKFAYQTLTTQMYFPGQPLNAKDKLIERKSKEEQAMMIAELVEKTEDQYRYNIFLAPVGKAVAPQQE